MVDINSESLSKSICLLSQVRLPVPSWHLTKGGAKGHGNADETLLRLVVILQEEVQYKGTLASENKPSGIKGGAGVAALTLQSPWQCLSKESPFWSIGPWSILRPDPISSNKPLPPWPPGTLCSLWLTYSAFSTSLNEREPQKREHTESQTPETLTLLVELPE